MAFSTLFIDLDDTVYPHTSGLWQAIRKRIGIYMLERVKIPQDEIPALRKQLFETYGTTMRGLQILYHIDVQDYLAFVHDVPLTDFIQPDMTVRAALLSLPQRKVIFTNADANHAGRVLNVLALTDCFDQIIDINTISPYCKPQPEAFRIALKIAGEQDPTRCALVDDAPRNLAAARQLGFFTVCLSSRDPSSEYHTGILHLSELGQVIAS
jgi:putative hydrolase of the HAD superfamily